MNRCGCYHIVILGNVYLPAPSHYYWSRTNCASSPITLYSCMRRLKQGRVGSEDGTERCDMLIRRLFGVSGSMKSGSSEWKTRARLMQEIESIRVREA